MKEYCTICESFGTNVISKYKITIAYYDQKAKEGDVREVINNSTLCEEHIYAEPYLSLLKLKPILEQRKNTSIYVPDNVNEFRKKIDNMIKKLDDMNWSKNRKMTRK